MSPEEYERIKASEKAHLMEMKRLKGLAAEAGRRGRMAAAIDAVTGSLTAGDDTREAMTRRLMEEAATGEARFEIAIEAQNEAAARAVVSQPAISDAELEAAAMSADLLAPDAHSREDEALLDSGIEEISFDVPDDDSDDSYASDADLPGAVDAVPPSAP